MKKEKIRSVGQQCFYGLLIWSLLGLAFGDLRVFQFKLFSPDISIFFLAFTLVFFFIFEFSSVITKREFKPLPKVSLWVLVFFTCALLFSSYHERPLSFFPNKGVIGEIALLTLLIGVYLNRARTRGFERIFSGTILVIAQIAVTIAFIHYADGRLIFSDDHPSFLYRIQLLKDNFPKIPFYNLDWNAGYNTREFFPSGVINVFLLSYPLLTFFADLGSKEGAATYTYLIPYLYVWIVPWSTYFSIKLLADRERAAIIGALLSLAPSLTIFQWMLSYGTIGFVLSAGLTPLVFSLGVRLVMPRYPVRWWHIALLLVVGSLTILWTLSAIVFVPLVAWAFWHFRTVFKGARGKLVIIFGLSFLLLNGPWVKLFLDESKVISTFVKPSTLPGTVQEKKVSTSKSLDDVITSTEELKKVTYGIHPLLIICLVSGYSVVSDKALRRIFLFTLLWLGAVAIFGEVYKPQLELKRMILFGTTLMLMLVAVGIDELLLRTDQGIQQSRLLNERALIFAHTIGISLICSLVFLSPWTASAAYLNTTDVRYAFASDEVWRLSKAIETHGGAGRTFITGFVLHELGESSFNAQDGGHVAALPLFTGKHMYASDYYHTRWSTVDPIPQVFRKRGAEGIEEFLDLVNATSVITFLKEWSEYCDRYPQSYQKIVEIGRFKLYRRSTSREGYMLQGSGEVISSEEGLLVIPQTEQLILKYRYMPRLVSRPSAGVNIEPVYVFDEDRGGGKTEPVYYIKLRVAPELVRKNQPVLLGYRPKP